MGRGQRIAVARTWTAGTCRPSDCRNPSQRRRNSSSTRWRSSSERSATMVANVVPPDVTPVRGPPRSERSPRNLQPAQRRLRPSRVGQQIFEHTGLSQPCHVPVVEWQPVTGPDPQRCGERAEERLLGAAPHRHRHTGTRARHPAISASVAPGSGACISPRPHTTRSNIASANSRCCASMTMNSTPSAPASAALPRAKEIICEDRSMPTTAHPNTRRPADRQPARPRAHVEQRQPRASSAQPATRHAPPGRPRPSTCSTPPHPPRTPATRDDAAPQRSPQSTPRP